MKLNGTMTTTAWTFTASDRFRDSAKRRGADREESFRAAAMLGVSLGTRARVDEERDGKMKARARATQTQHGG